MGWLMTVMDDGFLSSVYPFSLPFSAAVVCADYSLALNKCSLALNLFCRQRQFGNILHCNRRSTAIRHPLPPSVTP